MLKRIFRKWNSRKVQDSKIRRFKSQRGQTMSEYALVVAAVALVVVGGYRTMGTNVQSVVTKVDSQL